MDKILESCYWAVDAESFFQKMTMTLKIRAKRATVPMAETSLMNGRKK